MASSATTPKVGWQREREVKQKQKQWEDQQNDHREWQQNRSNMMKKKEEAEAKAKKAEASAPEFMKRLGTMREKSMKKSTTKKKDEGPTIEELDDGSDIPPWHRPNAPEKPEWVVLLLLAAAKEAEEEEDDDEHVLVAGEKPVRRNSFSETQSIKQQPWQQEVSLKPSPELSKAIKRPTGEISPRKSPQRIKCKSASAALVLAGEDKPEWMKGAEAVRNRKKKAAAAAQNSKDIPDRATSPCPGAEQPAWMVQRNKIKDKGAVNPADSPETKQQKVIHKSKSADAQPTWMAQRSKIKQKAKEGENPDDRSSSTPKPAAAAAAAASEEPAWMKHKLKARVSVKELQTSKVKEKVDNHKPIRQSSIKLTKEELTANIVKQKLAKRPSLRDVRKAPVKSEEMEWMKAKLKPRDSRKSSSTTIAPIKEEKEDKPAWMNHKLKPRVSVKELQTSKVKERVEKKEPIRQSSIKLTKKELTTNIVKQKLAKRPSLLEIKKAPVKSEEMEWMKQKLRPSKSKMDDTMTPLAAEGDSRPSWFKEASSRGLIDSEDENDETTLRPSGSKRNLLVPPKPSPDEDDKRPEWFREASSKGLIDTDDENEEANNGKSSQNSNGLSKTKKSAAPRKRVSRKPLAHELEGEARPEWMKEAQKRIPSLRSLSGGSDLEDNDDSTRSAEDALPVPRVSKQGSMRRIATMPANPTSNNMRDGLVKRQSSRRLAIKESSPPKRTSSNPNLLKQEDPSTSEEAVEPELDPMDLLKSSNSKQPSSRTLGKQNSLSSSNHLRPLVGKQKSFSSIKGGDATNASKKSIAKKRRSSSKSKSKEVANSKLWNSMVDLGTSTDVEDGSSSSAGGGSESETEASPIDFTASMNDISAIMMDSGGLLGGTLAHSKGSAPSLTTISRAERRKSRMSMSKKDRAKSRSRSGGSMGSKSSTDKKKKKKEISSTKEKEKDKKAKKKKKESDEKKKEKKKERRESKKALKAAEAEEKNGTSQSALSAIVADGSNTTTRTVSAPAAASTPKTSTPKTGEKKGWWEKEVPQTTTPKATQKKDSKGNWWSEAPKSAWWTAKSPKNDQPCKDTQSNWHSAEAPNGHTYYYNTETGKTQWEKPPGF